MHNLQQALHTDPELMTEAVGQIAAALFTMHRAIVQFDTGLWNLAYFTSRPGSSMANTEGGRRKRVYLQSKSLCFSFEFMCFHWVDRLLWSSWFSVGSTFVCIH